MSVVSLLCVSLGTTDTVMNETKFLPSWSFYFKADNALICLLHKHFAIYVSSRDWQFDRLQIRMQEPCPCFPLPGLKVFFQERHLPRCFITCLKYLYTYLGKMNSKTVNSTRHVSQKGKLSCSSVGFDWFPPGNPFQEKPLPATHFKEVPSTAVFKTC